MTAYLSPTRLRAMRLGSDLTDITDFELGSLLDQASTLVDEHCLVPLMPSPYSFLGGSVEKEQSAWRYPDTPFDVPKRRIYPTHWPVKSVSSLDIVVGHDVAASIPNDGLVINNAERWVEVTSLLIATSSGIFGMGGWIVPIGGLSVPIATYSYEYGFDLPEVDDRCLVDDDNRIYFASSEHWIEDAVDPAIKVGGSLVTTGYTIDYLEGRVTFDTAQTNRVTATYRHKLPRAIPMATGYVVSALLGDSRNRERGMAGLDRLRVNEIEATRRISRRSGQSDDWVSINAPEAAKLLEGYRMWSQA